MKHVNSFPTDSLPMTLRGPEERLREVIRCHAAIIPHSHKGLIHIGIGYYEPVYPDLRALARQSARCHNGSEPYHSQLSESGFSELKD